MDHVNSAGSSARLQNFTFLKQKERERTVSQFFCWPGLAVKQIYRNPVIYIQLLHKEETCFCSLPVYSAENRVISAMQNPILYSWVFLASLNIPIPHFLVSEQVMVILASNFGVECDGFLTVLLPPRKSHKT